MDLEFMKSAVGRLAVRFMSMHEPLAGLPADVEVRAIDLLRSGAEQIRGKPPGWFHLKKSPLAELIQGLRIDYAQHLMLATEEALGSGGFDMHFGNDDYPLIAARLDFLQTMEDMSFEYTQERLRRVVEIVISLHPGSGEYQP
jgi:hypothetical protein